MREIQQSKSNQSFLDFAWNVVIFPICEKLLMEPHLDIACIACSKQHIVYPSSQINTCIGIYLWSTPVLVLNHFLPKNVKLVTLWYKDIATISVFFCNKKNDDSVQTNVIRDELYTRKHFWVNFFVVVRKINSLTTLVCYKICFTVKICQTNGFRGC